LNKIRWIIFSIIVICVLAGLVIFSKNSGLDVSKIDVNTIQVASSSNGEIADHTLGTADSKVVIIEYGDFQCPGCGSIDPIIAATIDQYKDQLQFVFRIFPLTDIHPNSKAAASAAEAAGLQNKYWDMHTKIYATQSDWENLTGSDRTDFFVKTATDMKLDANKFKIDMASTAVQDKISFDQAIGFKIGLDSTPTFYLNGKKLDSTVWGNNNKFKDAINAELTKAGVALPQVSN